MLERFLTSEDSPAPRIEDGHQRDPIESITDSTTRNSVSKAATKPRKRQPIRVDADALEYRQDEDDFAGQAVVQDEMPVIESSDPLLLNLRTPGGPETVDFGIKPFHHATFFP